jgi:alpha-pyrone synthase
VFFEMPASLSQALRSRPTELVKDSKGVSARLPLNPSGIQRVGALVLHDLWAVHPGGTSVVDAVKRALDLKPEALADSREVLRSYGNMSSATVMFVLDAMMRSAPAGAAG